MNKIVRIVSISFALLWTETAAANALETDAVIQKYCEPLVAGTPAKNVANAARKDGFRDELVRGQSLLRKGEMLIGISDAPRACIVQAPAAMSFKQGAALADAWGKRHPGATKSPATKGPDGAPVAAWSIASKKIGIIATQQKNALGQNVMNFILMSGPSQ